jgi:hypothetical protein
LIESSDSTPSEAELWSFGIPASLVVECRCILTPPPFSEHGNCFEKRPGRKPVQT